MTYFSGNYANGSNAGAFYLNVNSIPEDENSGH